MELKDKIVMCNLTQSVFKLLKIEAVKRGASLGSLMSEAALAWVKFLKKEEMEERRLKNQIAEIETLKQEYEEIQTEMDILLDKRASAKRKYRR